MADSAPPEGAPRSIPTYRAIQAYIQDLISGPDYGPGERIPSERQLAELLGKNRMTVRKPIDGLVVFKTASGELS